MAGKIILVGGGKGGPGKSTMAQQIAGYLTVVQNKKVHVFETDIKQQTTFSWCQEREMNKDVPFIDYSMPDPREDISDTLTSLKEENDFVVVDAGGFDSDIQREAMVEADYVLLPIRPKRRDIRSLPNLYEVISQLREINPDTVIRTVINQCPVLPSQMGYILAAKEACESFNLEPVASFIYDRGLYDKCEADGRTIFDISGRDRDLKAEAEITAMARELLYGEEPA
ncbi:AAA family ATPase [Klebsiella pneumoniae]|nr:AAA family ATPase [Klebsiella pneumoniae]